MYCGFSSPLEDPSGNFDGAGPLDTYYGGAPAGSYAHGGTPTPGAWQSDGNDFYAPEPPRQDSEAGPGSGRGSRTSRLSVAPDRPKSKNTGRNSTARSKSVISRRAAISKLDQMNDAFAKDYLGSSKAASRRMHLLRFLTSPTCYLFTGSEAIAINDQDLDAILEPGGNVSDTMRYLAALSVEGKYYTDAAHLIFDLQQHVLKSRTGRSVSRLSEQANSDANNPFKITDRLHSTPLRRSPVLPEDDAAPHRKASPAHLDAVFNRLFTTPTGRNPATADMEEKPLNFSRRVNPPTRPTSGPPRPATSRKTHHRPASSPTHRTAAATHRSGPVHPHLLNPLPRA